MRGWTLLPCLLLAALAAARPAPLAAQELDEVEYAVYRAALDDMFHRDTIVVADRTLAGAAPARNVERRRNLDPKMVTAFRQARAGRRVRPGRLGEAVVASQALLDSLRSGDMVDIDALRGRFPGATGRVRLGAVGFNRDRTEAIVHVTWLCGRSCGTGTIMRMRLRSGRWVVLEELHRVQA